MIGALVETIIDWFGPVFSSGIGYLVVAGAILLDRSIFLGLVIPGDLFLALGGIYAGRGDLSLPLVIAVAALAGITGESIGYWLGRGYGLSLIRRLPLANRLEHRLGEAEAFFDRHGGKTVVIGRYVSVAGVFVPFVAGMTRMRFLRFLAFDIPAICLWAAVVSLLGYFLSDRIDLVDRILSRVGWGLLAAVVLFLGGRFAWKRWRGREGAGVDPRP
jgi:membrane protein DedA with SNARE-associated domain